MCFCRTNLKKTSQAKRRPKFHSEDKNKEIRSLNLEKFLLKVDLKKHLITTTYVQNPVVENTFTVCYCSFFSGYKTALFECGIMGSGVLCSSYCSR